MKVVRLIFILSILSSNIGRAQTVSSVYSLDGIGLISGSGFPQYRAMGDVGVAVPNLWHSNQKNPAFLTFNTLTSFQVGLEMDRRTVTQGNQSGQRVGGGLRYFNLTFPIIAGGKWTTSIDLSPYSTASSSFTSRDTLDSGSATSTLYDRKGGLTSLSWANGFRIADNLQAGLRVSYLFGSIEDVFLVDIFEEPSPNYLIEFTSRDSYSDFVYDFSLGYRLEVNEKTFVNFGAVYQLSKQIKGNTSLFEDRRLRSDGTSFDSRTVTDDERILFDIPSRLNLGVAYEQKDKLVLSLEAEMQEWTSNASESNSGNIRNTTKLGIGAAFTPDFSSVNNYLERVTYRAGFNYNELPYLTEGNVVRDFGINFGGTFPIGPSSLDIAFRKGWLGSTQDGLVRESYFSIVLGATINDRWFVKRRYD